MVKFNYSITIYKILRSIKTDTSVGYYFTSTHCNDVNKHKDHCQAYCVYTVQVGARDVGF